MKPITLTLAGRRYEYAPTLDAYIAFRELTGVDPCDAQAMQATSDPVGQSAKLIWCVLRVRHPELTLETVTRSLALDAMFGFLSGGGEALRDCAGPVARNN